MIIVGATVGLSGMAYITIVTKRYLKAIEAEAEKEEAKIIVNSCKSE
jgi:hypothetical protein